MSTPTFKRHAALALLALLSPSTLYAGRGLTTIDFPEPGDAGDPFSPMLTNEVYGDLIGIRGSLGGADTVDAYCITVRDPAAFYATTNPVHDGLASASFDTRLMLFELGGGPLMANDDSPVSGLGSYLSSSSTFPGLLSDAPIDPIAHRRYILTITAYPLDPEDASGTPVFGFSSAFDHLVGPGPLPSPYDHWESGSASGGSYSIRLGGAQVCGHNLAFVTAASGTGDLSTWTDSGGVDDLVGADAVCRAAAGAARLPAADRFVAWLSNSTDDAYCRAYGLTGTRATNCGEAVLPTGGGAYQRTDGVLVGPSISEMAGPHGTVWRPISQDQFGQQVDAPFHTGSDASGKYANGLACSGWSTTGGNGNSGFPTATTAAWSSVGHGSCQVTERLLCLQPPEGFAVQIAPPAGARYAFVTSVKGTGDLGSWSHSGTDVGVAAGDTICRDLASGAGIANPSSYVAWLSTSSADAIDRLQNDGPWHRLDGVLIAQEKAQLVSGNLETAVTMAEDGTYTDLETAWTGAQANGTTGSDTCGDWSNTSVDGDYGRASEASHRWTQFANAPCTSERRLYCFSDAPLHIFADGFESGNTSSW